MYRAALRAISARISFGQGGAPALASRARSAPRPLALLALVALSTAGACRPAPDPVPPAPNAAPPHQAVSELPPEAAGTAATPANEGAWFVERTSGSGIVFRHVSGDSEHKPFPAANGSGVGLLDFDLDGWLDVYFPNGTTFPMEEDRQAPHDHLYRQHSAWNFHDSTKSARLGHAGYSAGVTVGDFDADGFPDLYVTCYGPNMLYHNQGDGTFRDVQQSAGVDDARWATSAAFFDADADGLLDLYLCNYAEWDYATALFCGDRVRNIRLYCSPNTVPAVPDVLFINQGDGRFVDRSQAWGLTRESGRAQGVVAADLNEDGATDLYVGNDLHANSLFFNVGGRFQDATETSGAAYDYKGSMQAGMGVDAEDVDGDGRSELFVTNFKDEHNALYGNAGGGIFQDISDRAGVMRESVPHVGWGTILADFNLDGWSDLLVTNGHVDDNRHLLGQNAPQRQPALAWRNDGGTFEFLGAAAGPYFAESHVGRGLAGGDLDRDGDMDVVISHLDALPALLSNQHLPAAEHGTGSLVLRLVGTQSNRDAVGAVLTLRTGSRRKTLQIKGGGSYLSAHDLRPIFALTEQECAAGRQIEIDIKWPSGIQSTLKNLIPGRRYLVIESHSGPVRVLLEGQ